MSAQNARFDKQTKTWEKMINENPNTEIIIAGDFNTDANIWKKREEDKSEYEKTFKLHSEILGSFDSHISTLFLAHKKTFFDTFLSLSK